MVTNARSFWLDLGWLVMLVITLALPFVLDALGLLSYASSLAFWAIPILYLFPLFLTLTSMAAISTVSVTE